SQPHESSPGYSGWSHHTQISRTGPRPPWAHRLVFPEHRTLLLANASNIGTDGDRAPSTSQAAPSSSRRRQRVYVTPPHRRQTARTLGDSCELVCSFANGLAREPVPAARTCARRSGLPCTPAHICTPAHSAAVVPRGTLFM